MLEKDNSMDEGKEYYLIDLHGFLKVKLIKKPKYDLNGIVLIEKIYHDNQEAANMRTDRILKEGDNMYFKTTPLFEDFEIIRLIFGETEFEDENSLLLFFFSK